jgi:hypothetical protein
MPKIISNIKNLHEIPELKSVNLYKEKELLLYKYVNGNVKYCDGKTEWEDTNELCRETFDFKSEYIASRCEICNKDGNYHKAMLECHKDLTHIADKLKKESKGKINLYKTGSLKHSGLKLLFEFIENKGKIDLLKPEFITNAREYAWIDACNTGALIYCEDNYKGEVEAYDFNSYYAFLMTGKQEFPICEGSFVKLDKLNENFLFGIYKAKITSKINKYLFRENKNNFYTHIDLKRARELKYNIELIQDGSENFLQYGPTTKKRANSLFGDYMSYLYAIRTKYKGTDEPLEIYVKLLISSLWGQLAQQRIKIIKEDEDGLLQGELKEGDVHLKSSRLNSGGFEHEYINVNDPFKTRFARIKLFLLAQGRYTISSLLNDNIENVVQIQTDGFMVKPSETKYTLGNEMGALKLEFKGQADIKNVNNVQVVCNCCKSWYKKSLSKEHNKSDIHNAMINANSNA